MTKRIYPNVAIPPGETIAEELAARGWTQADLSRKMNVSKPYICKLLRGQVRLTQPTAVLLGKALGTSEILWINLERDYRKVLKRLSA